MPRGHRNILNEEEKEEKSRFISEMSDILIWNSMQGKGMRLMEQQGDAADPGQDSNFSIWSAGGYIFGYDEIDIIMEQEEAPESCRQTIEWEIR